MACYCPPCNRDFASNDAIHQHFRTSNRHLDDYCRPCGRWFSNYQGLQNHCKNSREHKQLVFKYECSNCYWWCNDYEDLVSHKVQQHHWCKDHDKYFQSTNNLKAHMNSKAHVTATISCPNCHLKYVTHSALVLHWESGTCAGGSTRRDVDLTFQKYDRGHLVTRPLLTYEHDDEIEEDIWARSEHTWNGYGYECPWQICRKEFSTIGRLNGHITSIHAPKRTQALYFCPQNDCRKNFTFLSGFIQHVESRACNVYKMLEVKHFFANASVQRTIGCSRITYLDD